MVRSDYVARNRESTDRLLRALLKAEFFAETHPNQAIDIIASASGIAASALRGHGDPLTYELTLKQALLLATENQVRWNFRRGLVPSGPFPDVLHAVETEPLRALKPTGVTISKITMRIRRTLQLFAVVSMTSVALVAAMLIILQIMNAHHAAATMNLNAAVRKISLIRGVLPELSGSSHQRATRQLQTQFAELTPILTAIPILDGRAQSLKVRILEDDAAVGALFDKLSRAKQGTIPNEKPGINWRPTRCQNFIHGVRRTGDK
ncbi:hypothetical protein ACFS07_30085 [Undibacterium arcticum]